MELKNFLDNQLIKKIDENWGNEVEISNEEFSNLSLLNWRNLRSSQIFILLLNHYHIKFHLNYYIL